MRRVLRSGAPTEEAELSLVRAALGVVSASGRHRPSVEGEAHFTSQGGPRYALSLVRGDGEGPLRLERWRLDREWAVRELPGGITLCWEGDMRMVFRTLGAVLPARPGRVSTAVRTARPAAAP